MIQNYFQAYDKMIYPNKYNPNQLLTKFNQKQQIKENNNNNLNNEIIDSNELKQYFTEERKTNMFLRLENFQDQKKISELEKKILKLSEENLKYKTELSNNANYIIKMEKMIQKLKIDNYNKYKIKFEKELNKNDFSLNIDNSLSNITKDNNKINNEEYEKIKKEKFLFEGNFKIVENYFKKDLNKNKINIIYIGDDLINDFYKPLKINWKAIYINNCIKTGFFEEFPENFGKFWELNEEEKKDFIDIKCEIIQEGEISLSNVECLKYLI